jgi:hypothetical protein
MQTYPITADFKEFAKELIEKINNKVVKEIVSETAWQMVQTLGEYEHGTAEAESVLADIPGIDFSDVDDDGERNRIALRVMQNVYTDLLLTMVYGLNYEKEK